MDRDQVVRALREIATLLRLLGESEYRARAYERGAKRLEQVQGDLAEWVKRGTLTDLPGIGSGLAAQISELVTTGRSSQLDALRANLPPGILDLVKLPSFGPKKAVAVWQAIGAGDLDSLERACREQRLRTVKGFSAQSEAKLLEAIVALRTAPPPPSRALLGHALPLARELAASLRERVTVERLELAGGLRRGQEELDDGVLVVASPRPQEVLDAAARLPQVARLVERDERHVTLRLFEHDQILDVLAVPDVEFATALLFATGSSAHVERLRAIAEGRGLTLQPSGLFRGEARIDTPDEAAIYGALGLAFVPPELRENQGELEAAAEGRLPPLIEPEAIAGVVHSHSTWSDGAATLEEMARAAMARGLRYLTVTEHSPTASYAGGVQLERLQRLWDEIDALNERLDGFRLLKGAESDILPDGSLDYPDAVLERLDLVIGSIHNRHKMDEDAMTRRILRALEHPSLHILGHATGRLLQRREPYQVRMDEVIAAAARHGVAIEVNGSPHRLDLEAGSVRTALAAGVKLVCSADAHSVRELDNLDYAVITARRGGARAEDVLNTLEADAFLAALRGLKLRSGRRTGAEDRA